MSADASLDEDSPYSLQRQRQRQLGKAVDRVVTESRNTLIDALMTLGKTHSAAHTAARTGRPITVFTRLWDTREQIVEEAVANTNLTEDEIQVLASLNKHCDSMDDPSQSTAIRQLQKQGATAKDIHEHLQNLVCQEDGRCTYSEICDFDPEDKKLIIGHPGHAYVETYTEDRHVLIDEDAASAFESTLTAGQMTAAVNYLLSHDDYGADAPVDSRDELTDLSPIELGEYATKLRDCDIYDTTLALNNNGGRADSRILVLSLIDYERFDNGIARTEFDDGTVIVRNYDDDGSVSIRRPPEFGMANCVIGLDGTPTPEMWKNRLDTDLEHVRVMNDAEREHYINDILGYTVYQTADARKPYGSGKWCKPKEVFTLLEAINRKHGQKTAMITSKNAREKLDGHPRVLNRYSDNYDLYFQNLRSKNDLKEHDLLAVVGSPDPGHAEVYRLAALDGHDIEIEGRGADKDYGEHGWKYFEHVSHNEVAQAIFRVGRAEGLNGADIYVHTACIPDWIPVTKVADRIKKRTPEMRATMMALQDIQAGTTNLISDHVDHSKSATRGHLDSLSQEGYVEKTADGRESFWIDIRLDDAPYWGAIDLE